LRIRLLFFERMTFLIVSMVAQMTAIAMMGFIKRMGRLPFSDPLQTVL
jgi:hypothetical protein